MVALFAAHLDSVPQCALGAPPVPNDARSWPTWHGDGQRSGYYSKFPRQPLRMVWRKELYRELTGPRAEVIVADGLAFLGTYAGTMYAWDAASGDEKWHIQTAGPIWHSPAFDAGTLYFGSLDGKLRAVDATTGKPRWTFAAAEGIGVAPLVHDGRAYFGDREGNFYAVSTSDGTEIWRHRTGAPILATASVSEDGKRVLVASEDMHVYCFAADGKTDRDKPIWKSAKLPGISLRDQAPTIVGDLAIVTTNPVKHFHATLGEHQNMLVRRTGFSGKDDRYIPGAGDDVRREQDFIVDFLKKNPHERTFHVLRVADGRSPWIAPILYTAGMHNPPAPPCVDRSTGDVYVMLRTAYGTWDGGGEVRPHTGVGKLDLRTGRVALVGHSYPSKDAGRPPGAKDMPWMAFNYIGDETQTLSVAPGLLLCNHQGFLGSLDLAKGRVASLFGKRDTYGGFYGPGSFGWENQGGYERAKTAGQPFAIVNQWHGPSQAIASVAGELVFYQVGAQVLCFRGAK
jgi:hypothetical protein